MAAVSQLAEFARTHRPRPEPGVEVIDTPRYVIRLTLSFPIPGPNSVSFIRCEAGDVDEVVREVEAVFAARDLPYNWVLDPDATPADLGERLTAHGIVTDAEDGEAAVMVLPADASLEVPAVAGLAFEDAYRDLDSFAASEMVAAEAFGGVPYGQPTPIDRSRDQRLRDSRANPNRRGLLATVHGEPAGSASLTLSGADGAIINAGAVRPKFRGRGVYRALVAARLAMARESGAAGLVVWGGSMSAPILARLGFEKVGWRRFYVRPPGDRRP
jgi:GNAT superfamily N-acetyltransferase